MIGNIRLEEFKKDIKGKKVGIAGVGVSNVPAIKYLTNLGAKVTAMDKNVNLLQDNIELKDLNVEYILGEKYIDDLTRFDIVLRSPGIRPFLPSIEKAIELGVKVTSEIELLIDLCPCKIIGVTGSDGKTTTTTLASMFLKEAGFKVWTGGNIGKPLFSNIEDINEEDIVVLELSSFQLMTLKKSPDISIVTNISPNHLDYHRSYEEYIEAKANIFLNQNSKDSIVVLNADDDYTEKYIENIEKINIANNIVRDIRKFSIKKEIDKGVYLSSGNIVSNINGKKEIIENADNVKLVGIHNIANICAAASAVIHLTGIEAISKVITTFGGVEHRMEMVKEINGVKWYNDSIGTSPSRTIAGLVSFDKKIILIAGGYDKNLSYDVLAKPIIDKVKILLLIGKTADKIEIAVREELKHTSVENENIEIIHLNTLEECVELANSKTTNGDIVVMSPASASFDMYKNFEERGNHFKRLVNKI